MPVEQAALPLPWPTASVAGFQMHAITREQTAQYLCDHAVKRRGTSDMVEIFTSVNGQVVAMCQHDKTLKSLIDKSPILSCDSQPMVLFSKLPFRRGMSLPERVATTDLIHDVAAKAVAQNLSFYLLGGRAETNAKAAAALADAHPGLNIVGRRDGYFLRSEEAGICAAINALRPDIVWIGLGVPFEQMFADRNRDKLNQVGLIKTSGGCFRILAGEIGRAPLWVQKLGFEWAGRLLIEPRHVLLRYLVSTPWAIWLALTTRRAK